MDFAPVAPPPMRRGPVPRHPGTPTPARSKGPKPFLAIDGEGGAGFDGRHHYMMICAATKEGESWTLWGQNRQSILAHDALSFLNTLPTTHILITFFSGYDWAMILRSVPEDIVRSLWNRTERTWTTHTGRQFTNPVQWSIYDRYGVAQEMWELDWIPGKEFSFRHCKRNETPGKWRKVWDCGGFFQTSLVKALEGWRIGTDDEITMVRAEKERRSSFGPFLGERERTYCILECRLLCDLMERVRGETESQGFPLRRYSGAGALAASILTKWDCRSAIGKLPKPVEMAASRAYFGGRFESSLVGPYAEKVHEYDIRSAYPSIIAELPCLACGKWRQVEKFDPDARWGIWQVDWEIPHAKIQSPYYGFGPFPHRDKSGLIRYPLAGRGWYYTREVTEGYRVYGKRLRIRRGYIYQTKCEHHPFSDVPSLYRRRAELKAQDHAGEQVLKLGLNSLYGKLAQTIGTKPFSSPVWAGLITSETRAKLFSVIEPWFCQFPNAFMFATDAIFSREPLDLPIGTGLGQWEYHKWEDIFIVQPGIYSVNWRTALSTEAAPKTRTRGFGRKAFRLGDAVDAWERHTPLTVRFPMFVGVGRSLQSSIYPMGTWIEDSKEVRFFVGTKRITSPLFVESHGGATYLPPWPGNPRSLSAIYKPLAPNAEIREWERMIEEQPDPAQFVHDLSALKIDARPGGGFWGLLEHGGGKV